MKLRKVLKAVLLLDLSAAAVCWLVLWFINGTEPAGGYKAIYVLSMINAVILIYVLETQKKRGRQNV